MPDNEVAGKSLLALLWAELDRFVDEFQEANEYVDARMDVGEARGRAHAAAVCVALVTNPYHPDVDVIKQEAMERWEDRNEVARVQNERPTLASKMQRRAARRARRESLRNG